MAKSQADNLLDPSTTSASPDYGDDLDNSEADARVREADSNQVDVVNISAQVVRFEIEGNRYVLRPGQTVSLHKSYALERKHAKNRDAIPSVIEMLTSKMVLQVNDHRARGAVGRR